MILTYLLTYYSLYSALCLLQGGIETDERMNSEGHVEYTKQSLEVEYSSECHSD